MMMLLLVPQPLSENNFVHSFVENTQANKYNTAYSSRESTTENVLLLVFSGRYLRNKPKKSWMFEKDFLWVMIIMMDMRNMSTTCPAGIYSFKFNNEKIRTMCESCSKSMLVSLRFNTLFCCFHCGLWTSKSSSVINWQKPRRPY